MNVGDTLDSSSACLNGSLFALSQPQISIVKVSKVSIIVVFFHELVNVS